MNPQFVDTFLFILSPILLAGPVNLQGKYAFDWYNPSNSQCIRINSKLEKKLKKGFCDASKRTNFGGDDKPASVSCKDKTGKFEYLVYESLKDCRIARETTLANE